MDVDTTSTVGSTIAEEEESTDYVFRIISTFRPDSLREWLTLKGDPKHHLCWPWPFPQPLKCWIPKPRTRRRLWSGQPVRARHPSRRSLPHPLPRPSLQKKWTATTMKLPKDAGDEALLGKTSLNVSITTSPCLPFSMHSGASFPEWLMSSLVSSRSAVKKLCDTMRRQILSRAFYGCESHSPLAPCPFQAVTLTWVDYLWLQGCRTVGIWRPWEPICLDWWTLWLSRWMIQWTPRVEWPLSSGMRCHKMEWSVSSFFLINNSSFTNHWMFTGMCYVLLM